MTTILDIPGSNPTNPFTDLMQSISTWSATSRTIDEAATQIVTAVTTSLRPSTTLWELWEAFFTAVVTSNSDHGRLLALLDALRTQSPIQRKNVRPDSGEELCLSSHTKADGKLHWSELPGFGAQWVDTNGGLEEWRDWDGVRVSKQGEETVVTSTLSNSATEYYLRFINFSTAALKTAGMNSQIHPINVFYSCKNVLESSGSQDSASKPHRITPKQRRALDIRVAATWLRDGGHYLAEVDPEYLRQHWAAALYEKTDFWPSGVGLTRGRWQLWADRLNALKEEGLLDEESKTIAAQAVDEIRTILNSIKV
ncbi:hypothetical protein NX059_009882 [Plenodomus lindquistii]|nr:hypothetical protein NX059_009882 [Plenodomus lindquistii]